jgi:hypothetical protein
VSSPSPGTGCTMPSAAAWGGLRPGTKTVKGDALFPRLDS